MYQLNKLKNIPGLIHGFSNIKDGNMSFDFGDENSVIENRTRFLSELEINPENCVITKTRMSHGTDIVAINKSMLGRGSKASVSDDADVDSFMTNEKGIFMGILTADCLPVILNDPLNGVLALAHLSRINSPKNFITKVIERMKNECNADPGNIIVGIGPCIQKESYIFTNDEFEKRVTDEGIFNGFVSDLSGDRKSIDLVGYNIEQMISAGIRQENIEISDIDTGRNMSFFSHYRSGIDGEPEGRMMTVVGMNQ